MADEKPPTRRAFQVYLYAVCLVTVIVLLFSLTTALFSIVRIAAPGTTVKAQDFGGPAAFFGGSDFPASDSDTERDKGIAELIESGILALVAGGIFMLHWQHAESVRDQVAGSSSSKAKPTARKRKTAARKR